MRQACILIASRCLVKNQDTLEIPEIARKYVLKRRAERQDETRKRIVDAAVDLHTTIGPAHTTDLAIAKRARVTRRTFYRHFPDEVSLFRACTGHSLEKWPMPDPGAWRRISDPEERLGLAMRELYAVYRVAGHRFVILARDAPLLRPGLLPKPGRAELIMAMNGVLMEGWPARGRRREVLRAAIAHATSITTWQSLVEQQGLSDEEAISVLIGMVNAAISGDIAPRRVANPRSGIVLRDR
jgi:AcrR family transcriptional regulator